ncbi:bifunctional phosphoribosylaminoimidazolecarboxamide formyltransferase/IMP cyclohydrolase [Halobaculum sp. MBLA0143]|uniref:bifunctional phosphoribosylaminoimidazolecarboxamide formyltransferase/IMP cyclohydrolase n=1 Tax=Halobaculum sp. MBLA0143 TaxID=3079933 RepID=UPI0035258A56
MQVAGMASNRGRNLRRIADLAPGGAELSVVVTNDADAPVLEAAAERGIPTEVVERPEGQDREEHERRILSALSDYDFELVCLDGYDRVFTPVFLDAAPTTLNVHPSLLPAFPGTDAHEQALAAGVRVSGCTVHVATEDVDAGPIVTQEAVPVYADDDADRLKRRVLEEGEYAAYPRAVRWFAEGRVEVDYDVGEVRVAGDTDNAAGDTDGSGGDGTGFPSRRLTASEHVGDLRYGENPHQDAALYSDGREVGPTVVHADQLNEGAKALSYNNYNDTDAAVGLVREFDDPAAVVVKHTNPAGCAVADTLADAYADALATDPKSAFGGIVALNRECDAATAELVTESFKEVVAAPGYTDDALAVLRESDNLRVLDLGATEPFGADAAQDTTEVKLAGGRLVQDRDRQAPTAEDLEVVTEREPTDDEIESLSFAWQTVKHAKSNAILFADGTETVGLGAGQVSRVDAVEIAADKAAADAEGKSAEGAVMASDAFFPFPDGIEAAADAGIEAVIQPGGSVNDDDVIDAADDHGIAMVFTGTRAFRHD